MNIDNETKQRVFQQVMDLWVKPEIERRLKYKKIEKNVVLTKIQIILSLNSKPKIKFNDEVKAVIHYSENKDIEKIELKGLDPNGAHVTLLLNGDHWVIAFDFRYNKEIIKKHIEASKEFYESAKENLNKNRLRPFFENAFASAELSAKSVLLALPDKKILTGRNHEDRLSKFKNWADLGNVKIVYSEILSKLSSLRDSARYVYNEDYKNENPKEILSIIGEMINFAEKNIE